MVIELGEACTALNDAQDLHANLEIKAKGLLALIFWPGNFNAIAGQVRHGPTGLGEVSGWWSALMATKVPPPSITIQLTTLTDRTEAHAI
jgi:oxysterol-binding protein-related protein 8